MKHIFQKRVNSFKYAINGIRLLFQTQVNGKFHIFFGTFVIGAGFFFKISLTEWCIVILAISMVIATEAVNTAIENLTDLVSPDYHKLAGQAKDVAAGGVLVCGIGTGIIGFIIFLPKVLEWLFSFF